VSRIRVRAGTLAVLAATALLAGCGTVTNGLPQTNTPATPLASLPASTPASTPVTATPAPTGALPPPPTAGGPSFTEAFAVPCNGYPTDAHVVALLRRTTRLLPARATATVTAGPMCAGTWQFTIVTVPDHDPLQVITEGPPDELRLVTAGTDTCTAEVRGSAPAGIRLLADCQV
jgi:hypothetical protein